jgi:GT2 family glycosyltransferase
VREQADELIVVDNGSAQGEVSEVGRRFGATVVHSRVNRGFSGGVNQGLREARGSVVAILNDDAVADPDWLSKAETSLSDSRVAAVAPKVLLDGWYVEIRPTEEAWFAPGDDRALGRQLFSVQRDGDEVLDRLVGPGVHGLEQGEVEGRPRQWRWTRPPKPCYVPVPDGHWSGELAINGEDHIDGGAPCRLLNNAGLYLRSDGYSGDLGLGSPDDGRWDRPHEPFGMSGTAVVIRASALATIGLFADPFFAYYEDTDWSWRARRLGHRLVYDPSATVSHRRSATSVQTLGAKVRILGERNRLLCMVRNAPYDIAAREVRRRIVDGPDHGIRRGMARLLPWAAASRVRLSQRASLGADEVWRTWAGTDVEWDDSPITLRGDDRA